MKNFIILLSFFPLSIMAGDFEINVRSESESAFYSTLYLSNQVTLKKIDLRKVKYKKDKQCKFNKIQLDAGNRILEFKYKSGLGRSKGKHIFSHLFTAGEEYYSFPTVRNTKEGPVVDYNIRPCYPKIDGLQQYEIDILVAFAKKYCIHSCQ